MANGCIDGTLMPHFRGFQGYTIGHSSFVCSPALKEQWRSAQIQSFFFFAFSCTRAKVVTRPHILRPTARTAPPLIANVQTFTWIVFVFAQPFPLPLANRWQYAANGLRFHSHGLPIGHPYTIQPVERDETLWGSAQKGIHGKTRRMLKLAIGQYSSADLAASSSRTWSEA